MKLDCQRGVGAYCIVLREILEANVGSFYKIFARLYIDVACPVDIGKYGFVARLKAIEQAARDSPSVSVTSICNRAL